IPDFSAFIGREKHPELALRAENGIGVSFLLELTYQRGLEAKAPNELTSSSHYNCSFSETDHRCCFTNFNAPAATPWLWSRLSFSPLSPYFSFRVPHPFT